MTLVPPMIYAVLLVAGFAGFLSMLFLGGIHTVHGHHHGHAGAGRGPGSGRAAGHPFGHRPAHGARGHAQAHDRADADGSHDGDGDGIDSFARSFMWVIPLLSPLNWFSWFLGAGATGVLLTLAHLHDPWLLTGAIAGALLFRTAIVGPIWNLIFRFAGKPAANLEGCLLQTVEAVTSFNDRGEGLVRMLIDGRSEDVLARLTDAELARGGRVRRGESLVVEDVDPKRNACRVSRA